jgi:hypothetical protein
LLALVISLCLAVTKCGPRLQRRFAFSERRIRRLVSPRLAPISAVVSLILTIGILGLPQLHLHRLILEQAIVYALSWIVFFGMTPWLLHFGVVPLVALLVAVYILCFPAVYIPPQVRQPPPLRTPHLRPARKFGRPRRGASPYGTKSIGRIRSEAFGPKFQPILPTIQEEPLCSWPEPPVAVLGPDATIRTTTRVVVRIPYSSGKPPLCPKTPQQHQRIASSGQPSRKRSADGDLLEDQRPSKRVKRTAEQETFVPLPTVVVLLSDDDDGSLEDDDGDFYFMSTQDYCTPLASVETGDCASLTYSECDDLEDDILEGIDIDLDELSDKVGVVSSGDSQLESLVSLVGLDEMVMACLVASTWTSLATSLGVAPPLNVVVPSGTVLTASEVAELDDDAKVLTASEVAELDGSPAVAFECRMGVSPWFSVPVRRSARRKSVLTESEAAELDDDCTLHAHRLIVV